MIVSRPEKNGKAQAGVSKGGLDQSRVIRIAFSVWSW